jgi:hypothetical protein
MITLDDYEAAKTLVSEYKHKKETLDKLRSCHKQHVKVTVEDGDHTGVIQFSIDKPKDLKFTLPIDYLLEALDIEVNKLKVNLQLRGIYVDPMDGLSSVRAVTPCVIDEPTTPPESPFQNSEMIDDDIPF